MNTYIETAQGNYTFEGMTIPNAPANRHYQTMNQEVDDGEATITAYVKPASEFITDAVDQRVAKEGEGVNWTAPGGDVLLFDSSIESQGRFAAAVTADGRGSARGANGIWKCFNVTNGTIDYPPLNPAALGMVADLVTAHVQKCFNAEKATVEKILAGDMSANFETEFNAL